MTTQTKRGEHSRHRHRPAPSPGWRPAGRTVGDPVAGVAGTRGQGWERALTHPPRAFREPSASVLRMDRRWGGGREEGGLGHRSWHLEKWRWCWGRGVRGGGQEGLQDPPVSWTETGGERRVEEDAHVSDPGIEEDGASPGRWASTRGPRPGVPLRPEEFRRLWDTPCADGVWAVICKSRVWKRVQFGTGQRLQSIRPRRPQRPRSCLPG